MLRGYVGAVIGSVGIAMTTRKMFAPQLKNLTGGKMVIANAFLNYIAAAFPGALNCTLMR